MSRLSVSPETPPPVPAILVEVDRAVAELRRGGVVAVTGAENAETWLVIAAEAASQANLDRLTRLRPDTAPMILITKRRAAVLGLAEASAECAVMAAIPDDGRIDEDLVLALADPVAGHHPGGVTAHAIESDSSAEAVIALAKLARLLPAAVALSVEPAQIPADAPRVTAQAIGRYQHEAADTLRVVSEARVPLADSENTRIIAFRPSDGGIEHLAIVIGEPDPDHPVLARLHSECFTGDLLGSLRCDCGDQLRGAIAEIAAQGSGVLLYLAQEGRGIGLVNKLRAYRLQDAGFDTLDANEQLGFDDDERLYQPAAAMLRQLGIAKVRLLTNNPLKVEALARHGIDVAERVAHVFPSNQHNELYLRTKATRSGHLF